MMFIKFLTQGGQVTLHNWRMLKQVMGVTLFLSLSGVSCFCVIKTYREVTSYQLYLTQIHLFAMTHNAFSMNQKANNQMQVKDPYDHTWTLSSIQIVRHPFIQHHVQYVKDRIWVNGKLALQGFMILFTLLCGFWVWRGHLNSKKDILSGSKEVPVKDLTALIHKRDCASDIKLGELPLIKDRETEHMLIIGTTGCGKTNAMNQLIQQLRARGDKIIIVDTTNGFVKRFYDETRDIILNPLDSRSKSWNLWKECSENYLFDEFAESLIPQIGHDPFWSNAARTVLTVAARKLESERDFSFQSLMDVTVSLPLKEVYPYFAGSIAASMMHPDSEKTALSIRATIASAIKCFEHLHDLEENFSIRQWVLDSAQSGILFLSCSPEQRASLRPLLSGWLSLATKAALSLSEGGCKKTWFFIDELSSLNKLPSLPNAMAEVRKYGGCFVLGLQNLSQLDDLYGTNMSRSICGLTGTKLVFRSPDAYTAKRMSEFLGEQEIIEHSESISFGAHQMRDGVSLAEQRRHKTVIPYTDILNLPNLQAYIKLPSDLPIAKLVFKYHAF